MRLTIHNVILITFPTFLALIIIVIMYNLLILEKEFTYKTEHNKSVKHS
jgi:hypothetical protein